VLDRSANLVRAGGRPGGDGPGGPAPDANLNINLFLPEADVARDAPLVAVFAATAAGISHHDR